MVSVDRDQNPLTIVSDSNSQDNGPGASELRTKIYLSGISWMIIHAWTGVCNGNRWRALSDSGKFFHHKKMVEDSRAVS
jgi:hypothetical protein